MADACRASKDYEGCAMWLSVLEAINELAAAEPGHVAHEYAAKGYWYDAFDQLTLWLEAEPRDARLLEHRAALLEQVGLGSESVNE